MGKTSERLEAYQTQMSIYAEQHKIILASDVLDMIEQLQDDLKDDIDKVVEELEVQAEKYRNIAFEYEKEGLSTKAEKYYHRQLGFLHSIGVVRKGGVE
jgi:hypothetical protein